MRADEASDAVVDPRPRGVDAGQASGAEARPPEASAACPRLGLITGAADDDPSAIGTYAGAGAALGPSFLVWSGIVQGFSTPPLMLLIMLLTNDRTLMGRRVNGRAINVLGW